MKLRKFNFGIKYVTIVTLVLVAFGSLMIVSAEMGNSVGDTNYLSVVLLKQLAYAIVGLICYFIFMNVRLNKLSKSVFMIAYFLILGALISCRFFGQINGAYAWIPIGSIASIQPSEFAKVFMIAYAGKMFNGREKDIERTFINYAIAAITYAGVIILWQSDLGSGIVLLVISFCIALIPTNKVLNKYHKWMYIAMAVVLGLAILSMFPFVTNFLKDHAGDYRIGRFLAAADPFSFQYDYGYHVIMSLVSFANGGLLGLGYGDSIHKYMNFPNPSNDFILPVIVEELGYAGFIFFIALYATLLYPIVKYSIKTNNMSSKVVLLGVFLYFIGHFILNVGGVSGFIPLTGVPLLLISSGGSSLVASLLALGLAQGELSRIRETKNESNSRQV